MDGTPIVERNMEYVGWNSHCRRLNGTQQVELSLWNGKWNMAGGTLIVERKIEHHGWYSHCETEHGTQRGELSLWKRT